MRVGTPPILQLAALEASLDIWDGVDMAALRTASLALTDQFIAGIEAACPDLTLATPRAHDQRGSQVSFRHPEGYAIMQALIAHRVIGDFRAGDQAGHPDILRFGFTPLYLGFEDVWQAVEHLHQVLESGEWQRPEFNRQHAVT